MFRLHKTQTGPHTYDTQVYEAVNDVWEAETAENVVVSKAPPAPKEQKPLESWQDELARHNRVHDQIPRAKTYDQYVEAGRSALSKAIAFELEMMTMTDETAVLYHAARTQFLGAIGLRPLPEDLRDVTDRTVTPGVLFMYAYCAEKESQAPHVRPYEDVTIQEFFDRREDLRRVAEETYETFRHMTGGRATQSGTVLQIVPAASNVEPSYVEQPQAYPVAA